jgi:hypothetical protein
MSLSQTKNAMCYSLVNNYNQLINPVRMARSAFKNDLTDFISGLSGVDYLSPEEVNLNLGSVSSQLEDVVPGSTASAINDAYDFFRNCSYLYDNSTLMSTIYGMVTGLVDYLDSILDDLGLSIFSAGKKASNMDVKLSKRGNHISDKLQQCDKLLTCVDALCGSSYSYEAEVIGDELDYIYSDLEIVQDPADSNYGKLNYSSIYTGAGLSSADQTSMNLAVNGINTIKNGIYTSIENSVSAANLYLS